MLKRAVAAGLALIALGCREPPNTEPAPAALGTGHNVLLITIDTLRSDHLGGYGYGRDTSPRIDDLAGRGALFESAYTYWPKTRASMAMLLTGRTPPRNGFSKQHPMILDFNPTIADSLSRAGYETMAVVDNPNVAAQHGYAKGFERFRETWQETGLVSEMDRTRAITQEAVDFIAQRSQERPFFLWLHYVNPHTPYTPPAPFDTKFIDESTRQGPALPTVKGFDGGIPDRWAVSGEDRVGFYVAQYDGEIATVDQEVGRVIDALDAAGVFDETLVVLTSDHGESLGEHGYYFDHGANIHNPSMIVPMIVVAPGTRPGLRVASLASTLDVYPTILDDAKVAFPGGLMGESLLPAATGRAASSRERLFAQNDHHHRGTWTESMKLIARPVGDEDQWLLFDRAADPGELENVRKQMPAAFAREKTAIDEYFARADREVDDLKRRLEGLPGESKMTPEACEQLKALGYIGAGDC